MLEADALQKAISAAEIGDEAAVAHVLRSQLVPTGMGAKNSTAAVAATIRCEEFGLGDVIHKTVLHCTATPITITDDAGVAQYGGVKVYDFPAGLIKIDGAVIDGAITASIADVNGAWDGDVALGTVTATTGATLTGTEANILQSTPITTAVANVAVCDAVSAATALTESGARWLDGTSTAIDMFLNFVIDDEAAHTSGTATFTGTISFIWTNLGDI